MSSLISFLCSLCILLTNGQKPNIIFLMVDQMDGRNMDSATDQYNAMELPNLRGLAEKGTQFLRHYTNGPQCVCGRSVLWTGRRTNDIQVYNNAFGIATSSNGTIDKYCAQDYNKQKCAEMGRIQNANYTILDAMESLNYDIYLIGKLHIGGGIMQQPIGVNATEPGFAAATQSNSFQSITRSANIFSNWGNESNSAGPINSINDSDPDPHKASEQWTNECVQRLNNLGNQAHVQSKPFFLYCSILPPHPEYSTNSTYLKDVNIDQIPIPNWNRTDFNEANEYGALLENLWNENYSDQQFIDFRKTVYGLNVQADYLLGNVIDASLANGFNLSNTYFVMTSDHGEMNLDHRHVGKNSLYEGAARIPLFIAGPNVEQKMVYNLTETVDILPTLLSLGESKQIPPWLAGSSLMPFLNDYTGSNAHPDYVTSQYHSRRVATGLFMVRKGKYKYIQYGHYLSAFENYKPQLFELENDPNELNDISDENQDIVNEMENILLNRYDYEYVDCTAKQTDMDLFNEFVWNVYNQTQIKKMFRQNYHGFNETDWQDVIHWRNELMNAPPCKQSMKKYKSRKHLETLQ